MNNSVRMQILQWVDYLDSITLNFKFMQSFTSFQQIVHALVGAQLKQDVHILWVFKEVLELYNISMFDWSMNFDFTHELLFGSALGQRWLLNNLWSMNLFCLSIDKLITLCKTTLAEEFALIVLAHSILTVALLVLFSDDSLFFIFHLVFGTLFKIYALFFL